MDAAGFDIWSTQYDRDVAQSDADARYPFAGYERIQQALMRYALSQPGRKALDVGIGTGQLAGQLAREGFDVWGVDFSMDMLEMARSQAPDARLLQWDFSDGLPPEVLAERFDLVYCNYAIHHLNPAQQQGLIAGMMHTLLPHGTLLMADVATQTQEQMALARQADQDAWDDEEHYLVADRVAAWCPQYTVLFTPFSYCSGIVRLQHKR